MTNPAIQDQLAHLTQFARHATRTMIVKVTAVDLDGGVCTVDAQDDGGVITDVPFFGNDPVVGDLCLAWVFDGTIAVMGNEPLKNKTIGISNVCNASSGWAMISSAVYYGKELCQFYFNISRTGAAIPAVATGNPGNIAMAQMKTGFPWPLSTVGFTMIGGDRQLGGYLDAVSGVLMLTFTPPNNIISTGFSFNGTASYVYKET